MILEKPLNEAVSNNFSIVISAKIGSGQENFAIVHVHKKEPNHAPKFLFNEYKFDFDPLSRQVGRIYAYDIDSELDGQVTYSILSGNEDEYFALNSTSGELTLRNPYTDIPSKFTLTVRATDSSKTSPLSDICTVYLNKFVNESNSKPELINFDPLIVLNEQTKSQTILILSSNSDGFVSYSTDCNLFNVQFGSGIVKLQHELGTDNFGQSFNCSFFAYNTVNNQITKIPVHIKVKQ